MGVASFSICPYLRITGNYCPLCGGTRYISNIYNVFKNPFYLLHPFGIITICVLFEIIFRVFVLVKKLYTKKIVIFDIISFNISNTFCNL